ncbi:molybdopterin molybdotransferase MoeA [Baekduia sp. Peel2402]|uniref:molybdopterin molybdotransferase MoeA n=1 Tax=Baekduia sp. Peel2402 TaxID=3458296 RepID=UPI00403E9AB7
MPPLPSVDEARATLLNAVRPLTPVNLPVAEALGLVLAEEVTAGYDSPAFDNSAMDGFATRNGRAGDRLRLIGESRAGVPYDGTLNDGEAIRISTGAALPDGADGVLQQELVDVEGDTIVLREDVPAGRNLRTAGDDLRKGTRVLTKGTRIGPAQLGVAIGAGRMHLLVGPRPRLAVVTTGDELVAPGTPLQPGQIHDSNGPTLTALAARAGAEVVGYGHATDDPEATQEIVSEALDAADVVVIAGGISVGPHDHVKPVLEALGVRQLLWRVALKPGKPTWIGIRDQDGKIVLGLPGNPVSAYVTFLLFARPALAALQGADGSVPRTEATLATAVPRNADRDELVRVRRLPDGTVEPTGPQGSHVLSSLLHADALAIIPRGDGAIPQGATVDLEPV